MTIYVHYHGVFDMSCSLNNLALEYYILPVQNAKILIKCPIDKQSFRFFCHNSMILGGFYISLRYMIEAVAYCVCTLHYNDVISAEYGFFKLVLCLKIIADSLLFFSLFLYSSSVFIYLFNFFLGFFFWSDFL